MHSPSASRSSYTRSRFAHGRTSARDPIRSETWLPGVRIGQISSEEYAQIYVPFLNWTVMLFTVSLTVHFGSSDRLAAADGTAVSTTMVLTTVTSLQSCDAG